MKKYAVALLLLVLLGCDTVVKKPSNQKAPTPERPWWHRDLGENAQGVRGDRQWRKWSGDGLHSDGFYWYDKDLNEGFFVPRITTTAASYKTGDFFGSHMAACRLGFVSRLGGYIQCIGGPHPKTKADTSDSKWQLWYPDEDGDGYWDDNPWRDSIRKYKNNWVNLDKVVLPRAWEQMKDQPNNTLVPKNLMQGWPRLEFDRYQSGKSYFPFFDRSLEWY